MHAARLLHLASPVPARPVFLLPPARPVSPAPAVGPATPTCARVQQFPEEQGDRDPGSGAMTWPWFIPPNKPENTMCMAGAASGGEFRSSPDLLQMIPAHTFLHWGLFLLGLSREPAHVSATLPCNLINSISLAKYMPFSLVFICLTTPIA